MMQKPEWKSQKQLSSVDRAVGGAAQVFEPQLCAPSTFAVPRYAPSMDHKTSQQKLGAIKLMEALQKTSKTPSRANLSF